MPWAGVVCPEGGEEPGRRNEIDYCLNQCKKQCITSPLLAAMWQQDHSNYHKGDYISASMLAGTNCPRQSVLERYEPFWEVPTRRYWAFRGTLAHRMIEDATGFIERFGWMMEMHMTVMLEYPEEPAPIFELKLVETPTGPETVKVFTGKYDDNTHLVIGVNGTCDAYNPFRRQYVDQKSMADKKAEMTIRGTKDGTFSPNLQDDHVMQFNIYRWLIARTKITDAHRAAFRALGLPELKGRNFPSPTELVMQGLSMMHIVRSGSQYALKDKGTSTLYDIDPVPVLPLTEIEAFIRPRALEWYRYLVLREPAPIIERAKKWMCKSCAFNGELLTHGICFPDAEYAASKADKP